MGIVYICLLLLFIGLGGFIAYYIWVPTYELPSYLRYDVLKDVLVITLTVIAIGIGALSYLTYRIALGIFEERAQKLGKQLAEGTTIVANRSAARSYTTTGYAYWLQSKKTLERAEAEKENLPRRKRVNIWIKPLL